MSKFLKFTPSISIAIVLFVLTPIFSQAQTKPDWRYWRTTQLQMGLGFSDKYLDVSSIKRTNNNWEFSQTDIDRSSKYYYRIRINCNRYTMFFVQAVSVDNEGRTTDVTAHMRRMVGLVPGDVTPYCELFASGNFRNLPSRKP